MYILQCTLHTQQCVYLYYTCIYLILFQIKKHDIKSNIAYYGSIVSGHCTSVGSTGQQWSNDSLPTEVQFSAMKLIVDFGCISSGQQKSADILPSEGQYSEVSTF